MKIHENLILFQEALVAVQVLLEETIKAFFSTNLATLLVLDIPKMSTALEIILTPEIKIQFQAEASEKHGDTNKTRSIFRQ